MKLTFNDNISIILLKIIAINDKIYTLYVNIGGKNHMKKVLGAIGGFFVKIGRWIANTAWVQPLLIVGGIFAIIFSIPYIKRGIEGLVNANKKDEDLIYLQDRKISLTNAEEGKSDVDKLLTYLEDGDYASLKTDFAEKFFLTFVSETCDSCKKGIGGFKRLESGFTSEFDCEGSFKNYTIFIDTTNDDGDNLLKKVFINHEDFFDDVVGQFGENEDYPLLKNVDSSKKSTVLSNILSLAKAVTGESDIQTPTTFLVDVTTIGQSQESFVCGVSAIFFNYIDLISEEVNDFTKGKFLSYAWKYEDVFSPDYQADK